MTASPSPVGAPEERRHAILVVDDSALHLLAVRAVLEPLGHPVVTARSGDEALRHLLGDETFAAVLMDVRMPTLNGIETVRLMRARERTKGVPVIFMSGEATDAEVMLESYSLGGVADFLLKPFEPDVLRAKIKLFLELAKAQDALGRSAAELERSRLEAIFMDAPFFVQVFMGPRLYCTYVNRLGHTLSGGNALLGRPMREALPNLDVNGFFARVERVYATGEPTTAADVPVRSFTGSGRPVESFYSMTDVPIRRGDGTVEGVAVFGVDTTEQVHARELRERLLAIVGHDLRNPLNAIMMGVHLLNQILASEPHPQAVPTLRRLEHSADRMGRMIAALLDFAAIRLGGGLSVQFAPCHVDELVQQAVAEIRLAYPTVPIHVERAGDLAVVGDADRLTEAFSNLVGNAVQHGDRAGITVILEGRGADEVTVTVQNGGPLVPADLLPVIFDPFRRGRDSDDLPRSKGIGLGLYIARETVVAHGGEIDVLSPDADGKTRFTVRLPRQGGRAPDGS